MNENATETISGGSSVKRKLEFEDDPQASPEKLFKSDNNVPGVVVNIDQSATIDTNGKVEGESVNTSQSATIDVNNAGLQEASTSADQSTAIDILNDDTLLAIFSYLTVKDLIRLERVSKKWKELSLMSWVRKKKVYFSEYVPDGIPLTYIEGILKRAGNYITHLTIQDVWNSKISSNRIFSFINKYCKSLTHLNLNLRSKGKKNLDGLSAKVAKNLISLHIFIDNGRNRNSDLLSLLNKAVNLEDFSVKITYLKGSPLLNLTEKCKALSLSTCDYINNEILRKVLVKLINLEHLDISDTCIVAGTLRPVSNQIKSLDVSSFTPRFFSENSYKSLSFSNLRVLKMRRNWYANDEVVTTFINKCPLLEILDLCECSNISDSSFRQIARLKNLTDFDVSSTQITAATVKYLISTLENLKKVSCYIFGKESALIASSWLQFIGLSPNLINLAIGPSDQFEHGFFKLAEKYIEERSNNNSLTIQIYFSTSQKISSETERLKLIPFKYQDAKRNCLKIVECRKYDGLSKIQNAHEQTWCVGK